VFITHWGPHGAEKQKRNSKTLKAKKENGHGVKVVENNKKRRRTDRGSQKERKIRDQNRTELQQYE